MIWLVVAGYAWAALTVAGLIGLWGSRGAGTGLLWGLIWPVLIPAVVVTMALEPWLEGSGR